MLVLTRHSGQRIVIDGRITLTVNRIAGNRVALAFDAPRQVHIRRGEPGLDYGEVDGLGSSCTTSSLEIEKDNTVDD